jgi:hypothetical protein
MEVPLNTKLDGNQSRSGRDGDERNSQPSSEIKPRTLISQSSQSLYRLSYRGSMYQLYVLYTRAVCKVCGHILLRRVGTLWRCGDGLFFEVPPLASDALLTTLHPLLESVLQIVDHLEISFLGAPFSWLEKPRNRMGQDLDCMADVLMGFHRSTFSSRTQNSIQFVYSYQTTLLFFRSPINDRE